MGFACQKAAVAVASSWGRGREAQQSPEGRLSSPKQLQSSQEHGAAGDATDK